MDSVLVLIAAPGSGAIGDKVEKHLRGYGIQPLRWLAPGEALECSLVPGHERLAEEFSPFSVDVAVVSTANRRKRLLIADMDSTMIQQECIDELGTAAGLGERIAAITLRAMRGELDFEGALRERVGLLKGLKEDVISHIIEKRLTLMPGGQTLVATMKAHGAYTALISGGFRQFTSRVASWIGFDVDQANDLVIERGILSGKVREPILGASAKLEALKQLTAERGLTPQDAVAVGDGANDLPMLLEAGMGVALHAKLHVQKSARIRINHGDLTALLYLQGYRKDEFIPA